MSTLLDDANRKLSELVEKGYVTPEEILEAMTKPLRTGYDPIPDDYNWPKMPENWLDIELPDIPSLAPEWRPKVTVLTDSRVYVVVETYFDQNYCDEPDVCINGIYTSIEKAAKGIIDEIAEDFNDDEIEDWLTEWPTNDINEVIANRGMVSNSGHTIFAIEEQEIN